MDPSITAAIITGCFTLLIFLLGKIPFDFVKSWIYRKRRNIPEIMGTTWQAEWCTENGELYVSDKIEFEKWTRNNKFRGFGDMTTGIEPHERPRRYVYPIEGEVSPSRKVVLVYRAENYPTESLIGSACMELGASANDLYGYWIGERKIFNESGEKEWVLLPGKVRMKRIN